MGGYALRAEGLTKTFGEGEVQVRAVRDVGLEVGAGEVVLIMGPSGSGKTTLLSMLGAMLRPTSGRIEVDGMDLAALPERKLPEFRARRFGFVFQDFNLLSALSAEENVEFALNLSGVTGHRARDRARPLLDEFGLAHRRRFRPDKLSGGEKQRVAIARALAHSQPRLQDRPRDRQAAAAHRLRGGQKRCHRQPRHAAERDSRPCAVAGRRPVPLDERDGHRSGVRHGRGARRNIPLPA